MKNRHKASKKAMGGGVTDPEPKPADAGGNEDVQAEAKTKTVGMIPGAPATARRDRPPVNRKQGGRVGADKSPMSPSSSKNPITGKYALD